MLNVDKATNLKLTHFMPKGEVPAVEATPEYRFVRGMKELRTRRGWSQERLSTELEGVGFWLNPSSITKLEWILDPGRRDAARGLRLNEAAAIAHLFETDVGLLISENLNVDVQPALVYREAAASHTRAVDELAAVQKILPHLELAVEAARLNLIAVTEMISNRADRPGGDDVVNPEAT